MMTDKEQLDFYRGVVAHIVKQNGGHLRLSKPDIARGGTIMYRVIDDGGIEFKFVEDGVAS